MFRVFLLLLAILPLDRVEPEGLMADTGWLFPGTIEQSSDVAQASWSNLANLAAEDDSYATSSPTMTVRPRYVQAGDWGIGDIVTAGYTVVGIEFRFSGKTSTSTIGADDIRAIDPATGNPVGDDKGAGSLNTTEAFINVGGAADMWTTGFDRDDLADANFKIRVHLGSALASMTVSLDSFQIKIHYEAGDGPLQSSTAADGMPSAMPSADVSAIAAAVATDASTAPSSADIATSAVGLSAGLLEDANLIGQSPGDGLLIASAAFVDYAFATIAADAALVTQSLDQSLSVLENTIRIPLRSQLVTRRANRARSLR